MLNFTYQNPTRIVFGKGTIAELKTLIPPGAKVLVTYGGGSIKRNGVYDQIAAALSGHTFAEFGGIEPNPTYETCMRAVAQAKATGADFLLAAGGGSVLDGTKFIAAAVKYRGPEPWDLLTDWSLIRDAVPLGAVLTLPATGSEMNGGAVISRAARHEKLFFITEKTMPRFSILDPETTFTLPPRQTANGVIDAFVHVLEQYLTFDVQTPLQDRLAEAILVTLIEEGPKALADPNDYEVRANLMWCATNALNGWIACGVAQDWATHMIGHELTALYGLDHAQTLAVVSTLMMQHQGDRKRQKLLQYAARVWGLVDGDEDARIKTAIERTEAFFRSLGTATRLAEYGVPREAATLVAQRLADRSMQIGEHQDLGRKEVEEILLLGM